MEGKGGGEISDHARIPDTCSINDTGINDTASVITGDARERVYFERVSVGVRQRARGSRVAVENYV